MRREARNWTTLQEYNTNGEYIVPLLGFCQPKPDECPGLVSPWFEEGDLYAYLRAKPETSIIERLRFLVDIVSALKFMHTHPQKVIHGDLRANNVLVQSGHAYIHDFGTSNIVHTAPGLTTTDNFNQRWCAPERLQRSMRVGAPGEVCKATAQSDIFEYGMTCYEVLTGNVPWQDLNNTSALLHRTMYAQSLPPLIGILEPEDSPYRRLVERCWAYQPSDRPTAGDVFLEVSSLLSSARKQDAQDMIK